MTSPSILLCMFVNKGLVGLWGSGWKESGNNLPIYFPSCHPIAQSQARAGLASPALCIMIYLLDWIPNWNWGRPLSLETMAWNVGYEWFSWRSLLIQHFWILSDTLCLGCLWCFYGYILAVLPGYFVKGKQPSHPTGSLQSMRLFTCWGPRKTLLDTVGSIRGVRIHRDEGRSRRFSVGIDSTPSLSHMWYFICFVWLVFWTASY